MKQTSDGDPMAPVRRERIADLAHGAIRSSILSGRFAMGDRLIEARLADELKVSRAPIREALQRLREEGLVRELPHRGMFVREFGGADIVDIYNVRLALETAALRLFMRRGGAVAPLRSHIAAMRAAAKRRDIAAVAAAEHAFHRHIVTESANGLLLTLFQAVEAQMLMALRLDDAAYEDLREVATEHEPIVAALEGDDETHAVGVMQHHIVSTVSRVLDERDIEALLVRPA